MKTAALAAAVVVVCLVGGLAFWAMSGSPNQPKPAGPAPGVAHKDAEAIPLRDPKPGNPPAPDKPGPPGLTSKPSVNDDWLKTVAALPADQQVKAVADELKRRNPGFDGKVKPIIFNGNGVVGGLQFVSNEVTDIAPLRALVGLQTLNCSGTGASRLADLSPLKGMPLTYLDFNHTSVSDLSPLKGMPLTYLDCRGTMVSDLWPLKGMPLTQLQGDFKPERDAVILRSIPTLKYINGNRVEVFWNAVNAK